jgi:DNA-binding GntR family transcriptional regulator
MLGVGVDESGDSPPSPDCLHDLAERRCGLDFVGWNQRRRIGNLTAFNSTHRGRGTAAKTKQVALPGGTLRDSVVDELRMLIASGVFKPGDRIVERDIAERLGTSRAPVRDAIRALELEGLVVFRTYAGACVSEIDRDEMDEIVALRRQVEYFSVSGAALRASPEQISRLKEIANAMSAAFLAKDSEKLLKLDFDFHLTICAASGHATLQVIMRSLLPKLMILFYPQMLVSHNPRSFTRAHTTIIDAIEKRDVAAAVQSIDEHIEQFYTDLVVRLERVPRKKVNSPSTSALVRPIAVAVPRGSS